MKDRNITILKKVIQYADEIEGTILRFELDYGKFTSDYIAKNAITMCILQIGELASKLTDEFKTEHSKMPWRNIVNMRHRAVHAYDSVDMKILWDIATINVPELKAYCKGIVGLCGS